MGANLEQNKTSNKKLQDLKKKVLKKIDDLKQQLLTAKGNIKKELNIRIFELNKALQEIEVLESSKTKYNFIQAKKPRLEYDSNSDRGKIFYNGTTSGLLNELKHAFQFETGKIDFIQVAGKPINIPGLLYDINDEVETYKRQYAFDGYLKMKITVNEADILEYLKSNSIKKSLKLGFLEIKKMKEITAEIVVKISDNSFSNNDILYNKISSQSLDINSSIKDIIKNNKQYRNNLIDGLGLHSEDNKKPYIEFVKVFIKNNPYIYVKY